MYENLGESGGVQGRANYLGVARRCSTVPSRTGSTNLVQAELQMAVLALPAALGRRIWQLGPRDLGSIGRETIRRILGLLADSGAPLCRDDTFAAKCWDGEALAWCAYYCRTYSSKRGVGWVPRAVV